MSPSGVCICALAARAAHLTGPDTNLSATKLRALTPLSPGRPACMISSSRALTASALTLRT